MSLNPAIIPGLPKSRLLVGLARTKSISALKEMSLTTESGISEMTQSIEREELEKKRIQGQIQAQFDALAAQKAPQLEKPQVSLEDSLATIIGGLFGQDMGQLANISAGRAKEDAIRKFENARLAYSEGREMGKLGLGMTQDRLNQKLDEIRGMKGEKLELQKTAEGLKLKTMETESTYGDMLLKLQLEEDKERRDALKAKQERELEMKLQKDLIDYKAGLVTIDEVRKTATKMLEVNTNPANIERLFSFYEEVHGRKMTEGEKQFYIALTEDNDKKNALGIEQAEANIKSTNALSAQRSTPGYGRSGGGGDLPAYNPGSPMDGNVQAAYPAGGALPAVGTGGDPVAGAVQWAMTSPTVLSDLTTTAVFPGFRGKDGGVDSTYDAILQRARARGGGGEPKVDIGGAVTEYINTELSSLTPEQKIGLSAHMVKFIEKGTPIPAGVVSRSMLEKATKAAGDLKKSLQENKKVAAQFRAESGTLLAVPGYRDFVLAVHDRTIKLINGAKTPAQKNEYRSKFEQATGVPWDIADKERAKFIAANPPKDNPEPKKDRLQATKVLKEKPKGS